MNIISLILSLIGSVILFSSSAYANVSMVADIILAGLGVFIGVNLTSLIIVIFLLIKMKGYFEARIPRPPIPNAFMPTIRDLIHQQRTLKTKLLCRVISSCSFLLMIFSYYLVILIPEKLLQSIDLIKQWSLFINPALYLFSFLFATFLIFLNQYYTQKIIHAIDFKAFKKMQKEKGTFIMPSSKKQSHGT